MTSFELVNLDVKASDLRCTLRVMIMEMKNRHGKQLFLSVDESWNGGIVFTFPKQYEEDARNRIADIGSYLHHYEKSDHVLIKHFTPEAAARILDSPWDEKEQRAISKLDTFLDNTIRECDDLEWMQKPEIELEITPTIGIHNTQTDEEYQIKPGLFNHPPDDDKSLQTFGGHSAAAPQTHTHTNNHPITPPPPKANVRFTMATSEMDDLTLDDDETIATMSSRLQAVEQGLKQVDNLSNQFGELIKILGQGGVTPGLAELQKQKPSDSFAPTGSQGAGP